LHPANGVTFYIREISPEGELRDVFLSDRRNPDTAVTYTSAQAYLVQEGGGTKLVMINGLAQSLAREGQRLFTTTFEDFSYDISALVSNSAANLDRIAFASTWDLITNPRAVAERTNVSHAQALSVLHTRFTSALMCVIAALVGFATLLLGSYSRFGVWRQILTAFILLVGLKLVEGAVAGPVLGAAALWPLLYLPVMGGIGLSVGLLYLAAHPGMLRRLLPHRRESVA